MTLNQSALAEERRATATQTVLGRHLGIDNIMVPTSFHWLRGGVARRA